MEVEIVDEQILELHQHVDDDQSVKVRMTILFFSYLNIKQTQ